MKIEIVDNLTGSITVKDCDEVTNIETPETTPTEPTIEERISAAEQEIAAIKTQVDGQVTTG